MCVCVCLRLKSLCISFTQQAVTSTKNNHCLLSVLCLTIRIGLRIVDLLMEHLDIRTQLKLWS